MARPGSDRPVFGVIGAVSLSHLLNDFVQSLLLASYPILKPSLHLTFGQIGLLTLTFQATASLVQPLVGLLADKRPRPRLLPVGMVCTLAGLLGLANAHSYAGLLLSAAMIGLGSSVFHPEASRVARLASKGRYGLAQSIFQLGGYTGTALGPVVAAVLVLPHGLPALDPLAVAPVAGVVLLWHASRWYAGHLLQAPRARAVRQPALSTAKPAPVLAALGILMISKYFYLSCFTSYYAFYLMAHFHLSVRDAQQRLFVFLVALAFGSFVGGPVGDRVGRKTVIVVSILGAAPFALALPHLGLSPTTWVAALIAFIMASAFSSIVVYAQDLMPHRIGMVSGFFYGFAFGMSGLAALVLGHLADQRGIEWVYRCFSLLPLTGVLGLWIPDIRLRRPYASAGRMDPAGPRWDDPEPEAEAEARSRD